MKHQNLDLSFTFCKQTNLVLILLMGSFFRCLAQDTISFKNISKYKSFIEIMSFDKDSIIGVRDYELFLIINKKKIKKIGKAKDRPYNIRKHPSKTVIFVDMGIDKIEVFDYLKFKKLNSIQIYGEKKLSLLQAYGINGICYLWLTNSNGKIYLFNYETQKFEKEWKNHDHQIVTSDIKDSLMITTSVNDKGTRTQITSWNTKNQTIIKEINFRGNTPLCRISPKGNFFSVSYYNGFIYIWETKEYNQILTIPIPSNKDKDKSNFFSQLSFTPNEKYIFAIENNNSMIIEFDLNSMLKDGYEKKYVSISKKKDDFLYKIQFITSSKQQVLFSFSKIIIMNIDPRYID